MFFDNISRFLQYSIATKNLLSEKSLYEFEKYYSSYLKNFDNYMYRYFAEQTDEITHYISKAKNPKVLEIGSGCGTESLWFALNNSKVLGIDLRNSRLEVARERKKIIENHFNTKLDIKFMKADLFDFSSNYSEEKFDLIWMEQAYHHIEPGEKLIPALKNILKNNGLVIISEANALNPLIQTKLFLSRGFKTIKTFKDEDGKENLYGDERIIRMSSLIKSFKIEGFETCSKRLYRVLPNKGYLRPFSFMEKLSSNIFPFIFINYNIVFRFKKD